MRAIDLLTKVLAQIERYRRGILASGGVRARQGAPGPVCFAERRPACITNRSRRPRCALGYRPHAGGEVASSAGLVSVARAAAE